jgi:hypothetical protein
MTAPRARNAKWVAPLTTSVVVAFAAWFWYSHVQPQLSHARVRDRVERSIRMLARKYPRGLTSGQWACCVSWTHHLHSNCSHYPVFPTARLRAFEDELNTRLEGEVDLSTIDWIWDEYVNYARGGQQYSNEYRPTTPARLREARLHWRVSNLDDRRMGVHLRQDTTYGQLIGEQVTEANLQRLLRSPDLTMLSIAGPRVTDEAMSLQAKLPKCIIQR